MNKGTIKVVNIGKPDIEAMSGSEQNTFFSELLTKISLLSNSSERNSPFRGGSYAVQKRKSI